MRSRCLILMLAVCTSACQPLPAGRMGAVAAPSTLLRSGNVYLIRGWQDLYSSGIDRLAVELQAAGVESNVYRASEWQQLARALAERYAEIPQHEPLVLIGFSYGADDVLLVSRRLKHAGITVDLVVTIDPVTPARLPSNVRACCNFYQSNGILDLLPWFRGVPVASEGTGCLRNIDLRRDRPDLLQPETSHFNIASNPKLHREIVERVLAACPPRSQIPGIGSDK